MLNWIFKNRTDNLHKNGLGVKLPTKIDIAIAPTKIDIAIAPRFNLARSTW